MTFKVVFRTKPAERRHQPAAVVVVAVGDRFCSDSQVIVVINVGPALQEQLDYMDVSPTGCHGEDTRTQSVPPINFCAVLQQDVGDGQVTEPEWRIGHNEEWDRGWGLQVQC